jgi:ABC-type branched-subunit amino acid transport system substrate-binding protein
MRGKCRTLVIAVSAFAWACGEPAAGPDGALAPSFAKGGVGRGWRKCFDANATPVTFGANWSLTNQNGSPNNLAGPTVDQVEVVKFEINNSCGIRVGSARAGGRRGDDDDDHGKGGRKRGSPLAVVVRDNQSTNAALSAAITRELIDAGAIAIVGGGASVTAPPAAQVAVDANVPFGTYQAAADALSGCTAAELADPAVLKSATPVYEAGHCWNHRGLFFRTRDSGYRLGQLGAACARETYPALTRAAIIYRDDDARPSGDGQRDRFVELGGAVLAEAGHSIVGAGTSVAGFKALLQTVTAGNPSLVFVGTNTTHLRRFIQAYVELRDDPTWTAKPANFNTLRFVSNGTLADNYSDVGATGRAVLVNQTEFLNSAWDPTSVTFQRWFALYQSYNPSAQPPSSSFYLAAYDALIVMALAVTAAGTTDGPAVAAMLRKVANPPGTVVCPGQWGKAFRLLAKGKDINYEGALSPVDLDERGNATGLALGLFKFQPDGSTTLVRTFGAGPQPACEDDRTGDQDDDEGDDDRI